MFKQKPDSIASIRKILNPVVDKWFFSKYSEFSLPQRLAVTEIHSRKNVLVSAPTGATKTLTSFLSILNELADSAQKGILEDRVYCVYVSPLKALNYDIEVNLLGPLKEIDPEGNIRVAVRTGDTTPSEKTRMLRKPPHILITTPESLAIVLSSIKFKDLLVNVEWCIIDEIHALAENKRGTHLSITLERLNAISPGMARIGLSATVAPIEEIARFLVGSRECLIIDVQYIKEMDLKVLSPVPDLINTTYDKMHLATYRLLHKLISGHKTTLIFTNTRAATERVVNTLKDLHPKDYGENIGAHHGSLDKELRRSLESRLRNGEMKVVVSSTSLELGIDIGHIDLVILLGSPKSVARALQRIGRSGHKLHARTKGRIIVQDRDDLVECSVLLKNAVEKKIDRVHIPSMALDVLAQHVYGMAIAGKIHIDEMLKILNLSYCYEKLKKSELLEIIDYLSGKYASLEQRHIYAKIWYDEETGMIGRKGRMARVLYMTNIGTIPDESFVSVKVGTQTIGVIDEAFLERLRRGDVFVLGGEKYEFLYARGMVAQVNASVYRPPTIPSWFSEMLPLSFDLAMDISRLRRLATGKDAKWVKKYLLVNDNAASAIARYVKEQDDYAIVPNDKMLLVERYNDEKTNYYIFHALFGRRVNDALARAFSYILSRIHHRDMEMGVNDNGFYISSPKSVKIEEGIKVFVESNLDEVLKLAIEKTEILARRFRHCAGRSLMILRNYKGKQKRVGRQQVSSMLLLNAVKRISDDFPILKEARREVLVDLMDIAGARQVQEWLKSGKLKHEYIETKIPSPFAFNLVMAGYTDILKMEDRQEFLKRMHQMVLAKISLGR